MARRTSSREKREAMRNALHDKGIHVIHSEAGWVVKRAGAAKAARIYETKHGAIQAASEMARRFHADVVIHDQTGRISLRKQFPPRDAVRLGEFR